MKFNGLMIDCSRLIEQHEHYFELLDFMAECGMNVLILHFTDDFGCAVELPGFEELAMPNAFSTAETRALIAKARPLGIDIIPEIELFGHTRYLTDIPRYAHLGTAKEDGQLSLNALNPFNPESLALAEKLIGAVALVFDSEYIHIGCDEVGLGDLAERRGVASDAAWADYVNQLIGIVHGIGKTPMIWADHLATSDFILNALRHDVVLLDWRYFPEGALGTDAFDAGRLRSAGFKRIILCPALAMYHRRWLPNQDALRNVDTCARLAEENRLDGLISTIWIPFRFIRDTMYYGIAYAATATRGDLRGFRADFAARAFGSELTPELDRFLELWPELAIDNLISQKLYAGRLDFDETENRALARIREIAPGLIAFGRGNVPPRRQEVWRAMVLAAEAVGATANYHLGLLHGWDDARRQTCLEELCRLHDELSREWDRTRFPDDPQKNRPRFQGWDEQYNLVFIAGLKARL